MPRQITSSPATTTARVNAGVLNSAGFWWRYAGDCSNHAVGNTPPPTALNPKEVAIPKQAQKVHDHKCIPPENCRVTCLQPAIQVDWALGALLLGPQLRPFAPSALPPTPDARDAPMRDTAIPTARQPSDNTAGPQCNHIVCPAPPPHHQASTCAGLAGQGCPQHCTGVVPVRAGAAGAPLGLATPPQHHRTARPSAGLPRHRLGARAVAQHRSTAAPR
jgi:hypothetical protein